MTKIFPVKRNWIWLSTRRDAQQVPRGEMPVWMLSCPFPKWKGKEQSSLRKNPQPYSHTEYGSTSGKLFPVLPNCCRKSHRKDEQGGEAHRLSPQCSQNVQQEHDIVRLQTYRKEAMGNQELVSVIFHPITWYPQAPPNVLQHHRQHCDNETFQRLGLFYRFYKNNTKPQLYQSLWVCDNVTQLFSSETQPSKI